MRTERPTWSGIKEGIGGMSLVFADGTISFCKEVIERLAVGAAVVVSGGMCEVVSVVAVVCIERGSGSVIMVATTWRQRILAPLSGSAGSAWCTWGEHLRIYAAAIPVRLSGLSLVDWVPIVCILHDADTSPITIRFPPSIVTSNGATGVDAALVEVFRSLAPFHDRESLKSGPSSENSALLFC